MKKDRLTKNIHNIGYLGIGEYIANSKSSAYRCWNHMITRCYSEKQQKLQPYYIGCTVDERWHNFQVFAEWYKQNYIDGYALDKDILFKGNKIYGPDTCCFVPLQINQLFTKNNLRRNNIPIGVRVTTSNNYQVSVKKFGKHLTFGCYKTINEAFNVYKIEKEKYINEVAEIWKNEITQNVYESLIKYQVEITD